MLAYISDEKKRVYESEIRNLGYYFLGVFEDDVSLGW